jgi:cell division protein ftsA
MDKKLIVAVDVSNNTLSVAAAYRYPDNRIDIVDYRRQPIDIDTSNGIIHNPNNILSRLNDCMQDIERHLNVKIGRYYLGIEPHTLRSETKQLSTTSAGNDISQTINRLTEEAKNTYSHDERSFLCSYPLETYLGATVKGDFLILSLADEVKAQIDKIFANLSTERKAIMRVAPTVEADTFVAESRKGEGVLFVDFGGEVTSFALYKDQFPRLVGVLPLGGRHITNDISARFDFEFAIAEKAKIQLGFSSTAFVKEEQKFKLNPKSAVSTEYSKTELAETIEARQCEIIDFILKEIDFRDLKSSYESIVAVGNATKLRNFKELLEKQTGKQVDIVGGTLRYDDKEINNPLLTAMLERAEDDCTAAEKPAKPMDTKKKPDIKSIKEKKTKSGKSLGGWMRNMFDDENESKI